MRNPYVSFADITDFHKLLPPKRSPLSFAAVLLGGLFAAAGVGLALLVQVT